MAAGRQAGPVRGAMGRRASRLRNAGDSCVPAWGWRAAPLIRTGRTAGSNAATAGCTRPGRSGNAATPTCMRRAPGLKRRNFPAASVQVQAWTPQLRAASFQVVASTAQRRAASRQVQAPAVKLPAASLQVQAWTAQRRAASLQVQAPTVQLSSCVVPSPGLGAATSNCIAPGPGSGGCHCELRASVGTTAMPAAPAAASVRCTPAPAWRWHCRARPPASGDRSPRRDPGP